MTKPDDYMPDGYFTEFPSRVHRPGTKPPIRVNVRLSEAEVENVLARKRIAAHLDAMSPRCRRCGQTRPQAEMRQRTNGDWECRSSRKCGGL